MSAVYNLKPNSTFHHLGFGVSVHNHLSVVTGFVFSALWGSLSLPFYFQVLKLCHHHTRHPLPLPTTGTGHISGGWFEAWECSQLKTRPVTSTTASLFQTSLCHLSILKHHCWCKKAEIWAPSNWAAAAFKNCRFSLQGMGFVCQKQKLYNHLLDTYGWEQQWHGTHSQITSPRLKSEMGTKQKVISSGKRLRERNTVTVVGAMGSLEDSKAGWNTFIKRYLKSI